MEKLPNGGTTFRNRRGEEKAEREFEQQRQKHYEQAYMHAQSEIDKMEKQTCTGGYYLSVSAILLMVVIQSL